MARSAKPTPPKAYKDTERRGFSRATGGNTEWHCHCGSSLQRPTYPSTARASLNVKGGVWGGCALRQVLPLPQMYTLGPGADGGGGHVGWVEGGVHGKPSALAVRFCCEPPTALKKKVHSRENKVGSGDPMRHTFSPGASSD